MHTKFLVDGPLLVDQKTITRLKRMIFYRQVDDHGKNDLVNHI